LAWNMSLRKGSLSALKGDMGIRDQALPSGSYEFPMIGSVHLDLVQDLLSADLNAVIDGGQAAFKSQTTKLATPQPQTRLSLNTENLDLTGGLPPPRPPPRPSRGRRPRNPTRKRTRRRTRTRSRARSRPPRRRRPLPRRSTCPS